MYVLYLYVVTYSLYIYIYIYMDVNFGNEPDSMKIKKTM